MTSRLPPALLRRVAAGLLLPGRTAAFVGATFGMYGLLEAETALAAEPRRGEVLDAWIGRYGAAMLRLYGVSVLAGGPYVRVGLRYPGRDGTGTGRLFVMNHRSGLDIPLALAHFVATLVSRADLAGWPVIGLAARRVGTLFVDRSSQRSGASVIAAMARALQTGHGVMVFPEGTTFPGDEVRPFKAGAFLAASRTGAEVVPVGTAYAGAGAAFGDEPFLGHLKRVTSTPRTRVALQVGSPISSAGRNAQELSTLAHAAVQEQVDRARASLAGD